MGLSRGRVGAVSAGRHLRRKFASPGPRIDSCNAGGRRITSERSAKPVEAQPWIGYSVTVRAAKSEIPGGGMS